MTSPSTRKRLVATRKSYLGQVGTLLKVDIRMTTKYYVGYRSRPHSTWQLTSPGSNGWEAFRPLTY
jgi:hypothetical protein